MKTCSFDGCDRRRYGRGFCAAHYLQHWHGRELTPLLRRRGKSEPPLSFLTRSVTLGDRGCWLWMGAPVGTYPRLGVDGREQKASRTVLGMFVGPPPTPKHEALHSCDDTRCVNPVHLRWGTQAENLKDAMERGRAPHMTKRALLREVDSRAMALLSGGVQTSGKAVRP